MILCHLRACYGLIFFLGDGDVYCVKRNVVVVVLKGRLYPVRLVRLWIEMAMVMGIEGKLGR